LAEHSNIQQKRVSERAPVAGFNPNPKWPGGKSRDREVVSLSRLLIALKNPTRGDFSLPAPIIIIILIVILIVFFSGIPITIMNTITIREDGGALSLSEKQKQGVFQCNHMFRRGPS